MAGEESKKSAKAARKAAAKRVAAKAAKQHKTAPKSQSPMAGKPVLLSGGNPQIAKGYGNAPVQAYIAAMPGWKRGVGRRLDALVERTVPDVFGRQSSGTRPSTASRARAGSSVIIASRSTSK